MMMMMMNLHENTALKIQLSGSKATENRLLGRFLYSMTSLARGWWKLAERYRVSEMRVWTSARKNFIYISKTARLRSNHALLSPPTPSDITTWLREVWVEDNGRSSLVYPHFWVIEWIPRSIPCFLHIDHEQTNKTWQHLFCWIKKIKSLSEYFGRSLL